MRRPPGSVRLLVREFVEEQEIERHEKGRHGGRDGRGRNRAALDERGPPHRQRAETEPGEQLAHPGASEDVGVEEDRDGAERHDGDQQPSDPRRQPDADDERDGASSQPEHGCGPGGHGASGKRSAAARERRPGGVEIDAGPHVRHLVQDVDADVGRDQADQGEDGAGPAELAAVRSGGRARRDQGDRQEQERRPCHAEVGLEGRHRRAILARGRPAGSESPAAACGRTRAAPAPTGRQAGRADLPRRNARRTACRSGGHRRSTTTAPTSRAGRSG